MLDQIWLIIVIAGLASGFAVITSLSIFGKIFPGPQKPLLLLLLSLGTMGIFALTGVYLRILDFPRHGILYASVRSAVWGFFMISYANYAFYSLRKLFWLIAFLVSLALFFVDISTTSIPGLLLFWVSSLLAFLLVFASGKKAFEEGKQTAHIPLRCLYRVFGLALIICAPAYLLDVTMSRLVFSASRHTPDGLIFAIGYLVTNSVILRTLFLSLKGPKGTESICYTLPKTLVIAYRLSPREINIAESVLKGLSDKEIAHELFISPRTVDTHLRNLYRKCGIRSRAALFRLVTNYGNSPNY